jgi:hypothetical protein
MPSSPPNLLGLLSERRSTLIFAGVSEWFTRNYIWEQIHALYRLTAPPAISNLQPRFNSRHPPRCCRAVGLPVTVVMATCGGNTGRALTWIF